MKPRKPRAFDLKLRIDGLPYTLVMESGDQMSAKIQRKFAAWLIKSAEYLEYLESKEGRE